MSGTVGPRPESIFNRFSFEFDGTDDYIDCGTIEYQILLNNIKIKNNKLCHTHLTTEIL